MTKASVLLQLLILPPDSPDAPHLKELSNRIINIALESVREDAVVTGSGYREQIFLEITKKSLEDAVGMASRAPKDLQVEFTRMAGIFMAFGINLHHAQQ